MKTTLVTIRALYSRITAVAVVALTFCGAARLNAAPVQVASPDGRITVEVSLTAAGAPRYAVQVAGQPVLRESKLGLVRDDADFSTGLKLLGESKTESVRDDYEILTAKRKNNSYRANRKVLHLQAAAGAKLDIVFQVSNDGFAFRYLFPESDPKIHKLSAELSSFHFPVGTRAWMQPMAEAKSGWAQANPSYEEYYEKEIPVGTPSPIKAGWVFPALFRTGDTWLLVSEGSLDRSYCASRLRAESPDGEYTVGYPDPRESFQGGPVLPESRLPWRTPWRLVAVGSLKTLVESTLGTDLAAPPARAEAMPGSPGRAAWSWPLLKDAQTVFPVQKQFIDYAAEMGWNYCLIDAEWDKQIGEAKLKELVQYGRGKGVGILVWYNSAGNWNSAPQTPRGKLLTHESRVKEFEKLRDIGVAGLKIDFFGGDGQSMIGYYLDLLDDADPYGFLLNFHGCTLPRGWQRTYPQLMTMESIRGLEFITFEQANADKAPGHMAMLPFTRNIFDPMDFTPMVLDSIPNIKRRTSSAFELATAVLFTSGIQHYAEIPQGMAKAPAYVRDFLKQLPNNWDDSRFLDGYPGKFAVIARKGNGRWFIGGINADSAAKTLTLDLASLQAGGSGRLITDGNGGNLSFEQRPLDLAGGTKVAVTLPPNGGFVIALDPSGQSGDGVSGTPAAGDARPRVEFTVDTGTKPATVPLDLYGQFLEDFGHAFEEGIHADRIRGRGFEGKDFAEFWKRVFDSRAQGSQMAVDGGTISGKKCARLEVRSGTLGIRQEKVFLEKGRRYEGTLWAKIESGAPKLAVRIRDATGGLLHELPLKPGAEWAELGFAFDGPAASADSAIEIVASGAGWVRVDYVSLMPADERRGSRLRTDMLAGVKALQPSFIRFPGGSFASTYHWKDAVGQPHTRGYTLNKNWGYYSYNSFGTDEFMALCREAGSKPLIVFNATEHSSDKLMERTDPLLDEALEWLEYLNGAPTTAWGKKRAENGHRAPYPAIPYLQIDNEPMNYKLNGAGYAKLVNHWGPKLRAAAPRAAIIACGQKRDHDMAFSQQLIAGAAKNFDILGVHNYEYQEDAWFTGVRRIGNYLEKVRQEIHKSANPKLKIGVLEWGMSVGHSSMDWRSGVHAAGSLIMYERMCEDITMSCPAVFMRRQSFAVWGYGAHMMFNHQGWWPSGGYAVSRLFREHYAPLRLGALVNDTVDAVATADADGKRIVVKAVNYTGRETDLALQFTGGRIPAGATVTVTTIAQPLRAESSPENRGLFNPVSCSFPCPGNSFSVPMQPYAVAVVEIVGK